MAIWGSIIGGMLGFSIGGPFGMQDALALSSLDTLPAQKNRRKIMPWFVQ